MTRVNWPRIAVVPGEPAGIGPDIALSLCSHNFAAKLTIIADPVLLASRCLSGEDASLLNYHPLSLAQPVDAGKLNTAHVPYVLESLQIAVAGCLTGAFDAMVTGPVHKGIINQAGIPFTGQTEYIAALTKTPDVVMMLADKHLRVALVTTHLPLKNVPAAITPEKLEQTLRIVYRDLQQRFKIAQPVLGVCGLNPHAGEGGYLGDEEITIIQPVLNKLRAEGMALHGALPADTAFTVASRKGVDAVVCMYHDQGLPVIKSHGFGEVVNITLGLPIIRTSVDHGTALELAGTGLASATSLHTAIDMALNML